jgi:crotonyl-CoA carboxylase/reductase
VGERRNPTIVVEHPGEATIPTSIFVCEAGGMVVVCAGTTGYTAVVDLRYHWVRQKRLQGSHGTNTRQAVEYNDMVSRGIIDPSVGHVYGFDEIGRAHQDMADGVDVRGNRVALVGTPEVGHGARDS